jgi:hypothetical protein
MSGVAEAAVIAQLKNTTAVTNVVGTRIYPRIAPQDSAKPYIVVMRPPGSLYQHTQNAQIAVARTPIFVGCVGSTYEESRSFSAAVSAALDGSGWTGSQFWNGTEIASCMQTDDYDQSTYPQLGDEIGFPCEFVTFDLEHST